MKTEIGNTKRAEHLERDIGLVASRRHAVAKPGPLEGLTAERVGPRPDKIMPVTDGKAEVILHPLAHHHLIGVVMPV